jgi:general secretion pathway protein D
MSKAIAALLAWLVLAVCPLQVSAMPTIAAGSAIVDVGDTFTIQVEISGAQGLATWQFDLAFDPAILRATSVGAGDLALLSAGVTDNDNGLIDDMAGSFMDADLNGLFDGVLAVIEFEALAAGTSALALSDVGFDDALIKTRIFDGTVTVNGKIPEPDTLALAALATGILALRRRQGRVGRRGGHAPSAGRRNEATRRPVD